jgi:hypothetical protein
MKKKTQEEFQRQVIAAATREYGFKELSTIKVSSNASEETKTQTLKKGVFKNKEGYCGIFCKFIDPKTLTPSLYRILTNRHTVENVYEGERFLLCLTKHKIFSFNIEYYKIITSIIKSIDIEIPLKQRDISVGIDKEKDLSVCFN